MRDLMAVTKALADENRVRALLLLSHGELCLCQIIELLGLAPSTVSKHMSILKQARLVEDRKQGRWIYYNLAGKGAPAAACGALRWLQKTLASEKQIVRDARRLKSVLKMDTDKLCQCYKS